MTWVLLSLLLITYGHAIFWFSPSSPTDKFVADVFMLILYVWVEYFLDRIWSHIATHRVLVVVVAASSRKSPRLRRFKSDRDEIWQDYSSGKYASTDRVGFSIWRHTFNMVAMTSFHAEESEECCHEVSAHAASARRIFSSIRQFLIHSTVMLVFLLPRLQNDWKLRCLRGTKSLQWRLQYALS